MVARHAASEGLGDHARTGLRSGARQGLRSRAHEGLRRTLAGVLLALLGLTGVAGQEGIPDPRSARIALVVENRSGDIAGQVLIEAAIADIATYPDTYWFELSRDDAAEIARYQAEVLALLSAEPASSEGDQFYKISIQFYRVRRDGRELLVDAQVTAQMDRGGRYQRRELWQPFVRALELVLAEARPVATVTIRSRQPVTLQGLPDWMDGEYEPLPSRLITLELRTLRSYEFVADAPGYRPETLPFYLEREAVELNVALQKYPRNTVAFTARGLSWPGVEYTWYNRATRVTVSAGVTTFAWGLTPLRQIGDTPGVGDVPEREAQLITSLPLTEIELGVGRLLGDRDQAARWHLSAGVLARITHGDLDFGLEPVTPAALRLGLGRERRLSRAFILSHRVATDFYWPVETSFLREVPWAMRLGPVLWQLPLYRLGLRVVL